MNCKTRLKKLEERSPKSTNDCKCFHKHNLALINQAYGESYIDADILPENTPYEGFCVKCRKQISPAVKEFYDTLLQCYGDFNFDGVKAETNQKGVADHV